MLRLPYGRGAGEHQPLLSVLVGHIGGIMAGGDVKVWLEGELQRILGFDEVNSSILKNA